MDTAEFYDNRFARTRRRTTFTQRIIVNEILRALRRLGFRKGQGLRILELGCGKGWLASKLSAFGTVVAVDTAQYTIRVNQQLYPMVGFRVGDVLTDLGYDSEFDLVVSMEVVEHIPYEQQHILIEYAHKYLKPRGLFILTTPNREVNERHGVIGEQPIEDCLRINEVSDLVSGPFKLVDLFTVVFRIRPRIVDAIWKRLCYPINVYLVQSLLRRTARGCHILAIARKTWRARVRV